MAFDSHQEAARDAIDLYDVPYIVFQMENDKFDHCRLSRYDGDAAEDCINGDAVAYDGTNPRFQSRRNAILIR